MTAPRLATAPVSFGIFGIASEQHSAREVVAAMGAAGFSGAELGPPGLFGSPEACAELFEEFSMEAVGAYVGLHLTGTEEAFVEDIGALDRTCAELVATGDHGLVILADEGDQATRANPSRSADDPLRWSEDQWNIAVERIGRLIDRIESSQLLPSFHPHIGTYVENQREIETLLDRTDLNLTLDTGHLFLAGIDPAAALDDYSSRINHIHIKDVRGDGIPGPEVTQTTDLDDWWGAVSSPLGDGDVDLEKVIDRAIGLDYPWLVIEQDRDPAPAGSLDGISRSELANRQWLENAIAQRPKVVESERDKTTQKGEPQ